MFGQFYHETMRKYVIIFGTLFNNIRITRQNADDANIADIKVPLAYGPADKTLARLEQDPNIRRELAISLPRMSFEYIGVSYAPERKLNTIRKNVYQYQTTDDSRNKINRMYNPVPYDITFELSIFTQFVEDSTRILEQILPYFTPEFTVTANLVPDMDWKVDTPIILDAVSVQDTYEADFNTRRAIIHTLTFTLKGFFFPKVQKAGLIKKANVQFYVDTNKIFANTHPANIVYSTTTASSNVLSTRVTITPGMDANGDPTTNSSITVSSDLIEANDTYDYITNIEDFFSGDANTAQ